MEKNYRGDEDSVAVDEILSLLQNKRTALKTIRIGIATIVAQTSLMGLLIATSKYHEIFQVMHWMISLVALNVILLGFAIYLIVGSLMHILRLDKKILKMNHPAASCEVSLQRNSSILSKQASRN